MADGEAQNSEMKKASSVAQWRQYLGALAATLGPFSLGTVLAWTLDGDIYPDPPKEEFTIIFGMPLLGGLLSGPVSGILIEKWGRKRILFLASVILLVGWLLVAVGNNEIIIMTYVGRFLTGFGGGSSLLASIAYISEFADASRRGLLLCFVQIMMLMGHLFVNFVHLGTCGISLAYICGIFPVLYLIMSTFLPESPRFLVKTRRMEDATACISWFRGTSLQDVAVKEELDAISKSNDAARERRPGCCGRVFIRPIFKPLSLAVHGLVMIQMCGIYVILEERKVLLYKSGLLLNDYLLNVLIDFVMILSTVLSALMVDRIGRRTLFIASGFVMSVNLMGLGTFYYLHEEAVALATTYLEDGWIPIGCTFLFLIGFSVGVGPLPWVLMGELVAPGSKGYCLAPLVSVWFLNTFFASSDLDMSRKFSFHWRLWIFGGVGLLGTLQMLCTLPETKKKSLEKIEEFFASKKASKSANASTLTVIHRPESTTLLTPPGYKSKLGNGHGHGNGTV